MELFYFLLIFFAIVIPIVLGSVIPMYKNHSKVTGGIINYDNIMKNLYIKLIYQAKRLLTH